jgi:hypothetical protein
MNTEDRENYADFASAIGALQTSTAVLQKGNEAILEGIADLKKEVGGHSKDITEAQIQIALLTEQVKRLDAATKRTPWYQTWGTVAMWISTAIALYSAWHASSVTSSMLHTH